MEEMSMNLCISYEQQRKPTFNHSCHGNSFHLFLLLSSKNATHIHYLKKSHIATSFICQSLTSLKPKVIGVFDTVFFGFLHLQDRVFPFQNNPKHLNLFIRWLQHFGLFWRGKMSHNQINMASSILNLSAAWKKINKSVMPVTKNRFTIDQYSFHWFKL